MKQIQWLLALTLFGLPARAADVADWALPDAELSLVYRGADRLPARLRELDARFGRTRTLRGVVARLQAWEVAGMHPLAGDFGPGLNPAGGVALFISATPTEHLRFVVGSKDEALAREGLAKLLQAAGAEVEVTPEGLRVQGKGGAEAIDGLPPELAVPTPPPVPKFFKCAQREHFLVCDTDEVPAQAPGRPTRLDLDARLDLFVRGGTTLAMDAPFETLSVRWRDGASGGRVEVRTQLRPEVAAALTPWAPGSTPVAGMDCLDARSGGVARLSVDGPRIIQAARALGAPPPEAAPILALLEKHWSGELVVSFAGGLLHPVIAVGLQKGADGWALLRTLAERLTTDEVRVTTTPTALEVAIAAPPTGLDPPSAESVMRVRVSAGVIEQSLVLALTPRDVERCSRGEHRPLVLPGALAAKGRSGLVLYGPVGSVGALPGLIEGPPAWQMVEDLTTVAGVMSRLIDQVGVAMDFSGEGVALDLWWEVL